MGAPEELDTGKIRVPLPPVVKLSPTNALVAKIEELTSPGWTQEKRSEVADLLRVYRTDAVFENVARIQKLVRESGHKDLTDKIYNGKF